MKFSPSAGRPFFPGGGDLELRYFQQKLRNLAAKINLSLDIAERYGMCGIIYLGDVRLLERNSRDIAPYLYENAIHPQFFADALHVIATKAAELSPHLERVNLHRLERGNLAHFLGHGIINEADLGRNFAEFAKKLVQERLEILTKIGVLVFKPGHSLKIAPPEPQLDLFGR